jgi:hypothetical protein
LTHKQSWKTDLLPSQKYPPKLLSQVTNGFVSPHSPFWLINSHEKLSRCPLKNSPRNCLHKWRMDSSAHTAPVDSTTFKENWVATLSEVALQTPFSGAECIRQPTQPLLTHKQSRKIQSLPFQK